MPEDVKSKKRKGATTAAPKAKKARKDDAAEATAPVKSKRKVAADFLSDDEAPAPAAEITKAKKSKKAKTAPDTNGDATTDKVNPEAQDKPKKQSKKSKAAVAEDVPAPEEPKVNSKKSKKSKAVDALPTEDDATAGAQVDSASTKPKKVKGSKKQEKRQEETGMETASPDEDEEVEDDQTAALLAGFESDRDSEDPEDDVDWDDDVQVPALTAKQRKESEKAGKGSKADGPGVIYVGRVPRGFFEPQMKKYFAQFGKVNRLRLSRNKKTGASKHYAFVEFASTEVADIVARTMDNYLMFGHILKCKLIPSGDVHPKLFEGAGQRFKVDPRNKKAGLAMERGVDEAQWEKRIAKDQKRRAGRDKHLKEVFDYEYKAPELGDGVISSLEPEGARKLLTDTPATEPTEPTKNKKSKKGKKVAEEKEKEEVQPLETAPEPDQSISDKPAKSKTRKSEIPIEPAVTEEKVVEPKPKKSKKAKKVDAAQETAKSEIDTAAKPKKAKKSKA